MKLDNALILGSKTRTNATGVVNRVCPNGFCDAAKTGIFTGDKIYISSITDDEEFLDDCIDYCLENKPEIIVCAGDDLYDSGVLEAKYHISPIMFLHKIGLLNEKCSVVGGICLDRDDADIMAAVGARLIVCPTYSCGTGRGIPIIISAMGKVDVKLGTFDNSFNTNGDIISEARALLLGTSSAMRRSNVFSVTELARMAGADDEDEFARLLKIKL